MKTKILDFLADKNIAPQEQFNTALKLFIEHNGSQNLIRAYSNRTYSEVSLQSLRYDLQKHAGITDPELASHTIVAQVEKKKDQRDPEQLGIVIAENKDLFTQLVADMSAEEKEGYALFVQYPFLRDKKVPNEFKILTNDKITAFVSYKEGHADLFEKVASVAEPLLTTEEIYEIASGVVEDFLLNQDIKKELDHYRDTKEILGNHEVFADLKAQREIDAIDPVKLQGKYNNLKSQISRLNKDPEKNKLQIAELEETKNKIFVILYPGKELPVKKTVETVKPEVKKAPVKKVAAKTSKKTTPAKTENVKKA